MPAPRVEQDYIPAFQQITVLTCCFVVVARRHCSGRFPRDFHSVRISLATHIKQIGDRSRYAFESSFSACRIASGTAASGETLASAALASLSLYPSALSALSTSPLTDAALPDADGATPPASLSRSSSNKRSAVFLPMPGILVRRAPSCVDTARYSSDTDRPDNTASAVRAPTPLILSNCRNTCRSSSVPKPNSRCASSRTTKWVCSATVEPVAGSTKKVLIGTSTS